MSAKTNSGGLDHRTADRVRWIPRLIAPALLGLVAACGDSSGGTAKNDGGFDVLVAHDSTVLSDSGLEGVCAQNGASYLPGDSIPALDGCGTCVCLSNGTVGNCVRSPECGGPDAAGRDAPVGPDTAYDAGSDSAVDANTTAIDAASVSGPDAKALAAALAGLKNGERLTNAGPAPSNETPLDAGTAEPSTCEFEGGVPKKTAAFLQKYKVSATYDTQVLLNPSTDVIYPGSVLVGSSIDDGSYLEVVRGMKNDITVSYGGLNAVTASNGAGKISGTIYPALSNFRQLHNEIMGQNFRGANSTYTLNVFEVSTDSSFDVHFGADVTYKSPAISASVKANFDYSTKSNLHKYMIRFAQTYYTVDVDQGRGSFLYKDFDVGDFKGYRPVYVSSIAYGRLAYITLESSESIKNIESAMNVLFSGSTVSVDAGGSVAMETIEKSSNLNITVIGSNTVVMTLDKFRTWLENSGFSSTNTGQLVAYKLRYVDDNSVANTIFNGEYTLRSTQQTMGHTDVTAQIYYIQYGDDDAGSTSELYGNVSVHPDKSTACPLFQYSESAPLKNMPIQGGTVEWRGPACKFKMTGTIELPIPINGDVSEDDNSGDERYVGAAVLKLTDFPSRRISDAGDSLPVYEGDVKLSMPQIDDSGYVNFSIHVFGIPTCD